MKRTISIIAVILILAAAVFPAAAGAVTQYETVTFQVPVDCGDGVTLVYDEAEFTLRLTPMYGMYRVEQSKTLTMTAQFGEGWTFSSEYSEFFSAHPERVTVTENADGSAVFGFQAVKGDFLTKDELFTIGVYATPAALPRLDITTQIAFSQITKEEWVDASFTLTLGTKQFESGDYEGEGAVKGRGNTSWGQPKKPYSIKLSSKASLLDIPKTKKYAIIPSWSDESRLRNYMAYKSALLLAGIDYVPKCEFVEAYFNGVYNGIYLLIERVDIEKSKINITEASAEDLTGGYLIEKDIDGKIDFSADQWFNCPYWANQSKDYFVLKTPELEDSELKDQMLAYLTEYMQSLHDAVMGTSGEDYDKYVDTPSWADFIILQEIAKNIDGNLKTSCYMVKKAQDDKLYMTAPWDFDLAFGNPACTWDNADYTHNDYDDCPDATGASDFMVINSSCPWFDTLYDDHEEFRGTLLERYAGYRETLIPAMQRILHGGAAYLATAMPRDEAKWNKDFSEGYGYLTSWLKARVDWLDGVWLPEPESIDLDFALNKTGGTLHFTTSADHPFKGVVKDGRIAGASGNAGANSSDSSVTVTISMQAGETLSFNYKVSTESGYDYFTFSVNGTQKISFAGERDWTSYTFTAQQSGSYTFKWNFNKDYSVSGGSDCVWLDNVDYSGDAGLLGDVNGDGVVDSSDALLVIRLSMELIDSLPLPQNADVNGDGSINMEDALLIIRMTME